MLTPEPRPQSSPSRSTEGQPLVSIHPPWKLRLRQILTASGPIVSTLSSGMTTGFSAVLLPQLHQDTEMAVGPNEMSWIASAAVLPMAPGCIISGYLMEHYGRRMTIVLTCIVSSIGWVLLSFANSLWMIYISRVLTGLCVGLLGPVSIVYIAETSEPTFRGTILAAIPLAVASGILCSHSLGTLFHWKTAAALCSIFPFIGYILLFPAAESPIWLVAKDKLAKGEEAFRWLRGYSDSATKEMTVILSKKTSKSALSKSIFDIETLKLLLAPTFVKPFVAMNVFFFIQQFAGVNAVIFYTVTILSNVTSSVNEYLSTFIIDMVRVITSFLACVLLRKLTRRSLAIVSAIGTALSLFLLGFSTKYLSAEYSWISLLSIILYTGFVSIGLVPLPWIMIGEVFPNNLREIGSGSSSCFGFFVFFVVVKTSPLLITIWGIEGVFTMYGIIALIGAIFLYCFLPETRNKTLEEIEDGFRKKSSRKTETECSET